MNAVKDLISLEADIDLAYSSGSLSAVELQKLDTMRLDKIFSLGG
jgi:hypothetical protein